METATVIISVVAVAVSCLALGWNIYRDVIQRPRLRVRIAFATASPDVVAGNLTVLSNCREIPKHNPFILLQAVNHGPGKCKVTGIIALYRGDKRRRQFAVVKYNPTSQVSHKLPAMLEVGDEIDLDIPLLPEGFLAEDICRIGFKDQYSRLHWVRRRNLRAVKRTFDKAFKN